MNMIFSPPICDFQTELISILISNSPVLGSVFALTVIVLIQGIKAKNGRKNTEKEFSLVRGEMAQDLKVVEKEFGLVRAEMTQEFKLVRSKIRRGDNAVMAEMEKGFVTIRAEIKDVRTEMDLRFAETNLRFTETNNKIDNGLKDIRTDMKEAFTKRDYELKETLTTLKISKGDSKI
jgi:hypothetical protein